MGLFDGLFGRASEVDPADIAEEVGPILAEDETIEAVFVIIRDLLVFTDRRLLLVDKQGVTGNKVEYQTIPYSSVQRFSIETAGSFDYDAELKMWVRGMAQPISKNLSKNIDTSKISRLLAEHVL